MVIGQYTQPPLLIFELSHGILQAKSPDKTNVGNLILTLIATSELPPTIYSLIWPHIDLTFTNTQSRVKEGQVDI